MTPFPYVPPTPDPTMKPIATVAADTIVKLHMEIALLNHRLEDWKESGRAQAVRIEELKEALEMLMSDCDRPSDTCTYCDKARAVLAKGDW